MEWHTQGRTQRHCEHCQSTAVPSLQCQMLKRIRILFCQAGNGKTLQPVYCIVVWASVQPCIQSCPSCCLLCTLFLCCRSQSLTIPVQIPSSTHLHHPSRSAACKHMCHYSSTQQLGRRTAQQHTARSSWAAAQRSSTQHAAAHSTQQHSGSGYVQQRNEQAIVSSRRGLHKLGHCSSRSNSSSSATGRLYLIPCACLGGRRSIIVGPCQCGAWSWLAGTHSSRQQAL
jgi:hypothetical protein